MLELSNGAREDFLSAPGEVHMVQASTVKRTTASSKVPKSKIETPAEKPSKFNGNLNQKIAEKAYELFLKRNGAAGSPEGDWILAEKIVKGL